MEEMLERLGLKEAAACACEVGIRYRCRTLPSERPKVKCSRDVAGIVSSLPEMRENAGYKELFYALYLDSGGGVVGVLKVAEGGWSNVHVDVRVVMQGALLLSAVALIIVHNHPSGRLTPSVPDRSLTAKMKEAAQLMDVSLFDSVIIGPEGDWYSFADEGML